MDSADDTVKHGKVAVDPCDGCSNANLVTAPCRAW